MNMYCALLSHFSCIQLFATPWTSLPGSSAHGILQVEPCLSFSVS